MKDKLLLYRVSTDYINYLKKFQKHIWDNEEKGYTRPYVGIVTQIGNYKYYVPLSSPKEKHKTMKDGLDFIKIIHKNELKAVININNIIPVDDSDITLINIEQEKQDYRDLLNIEMIFIRKNSEVITGNAKSVYEKITKHKKENMALAARCYDFKNLEKKLEDYKQMKEMNKVMDCEKEGQAV